MRRIHAQRPSLSSFLALFAALVVGACADAESRDAPDTQPTEQPAAQPPAGAAESRPEPTAEETPARRTVPEGTTLAFVVDEPISTDTHDPGDTFTATLRTNVNDVEGVEVLTEGTPSRWVVAEATTEGDEALLVVRLESLQVDGSWVPVTATVTEADIETDAADTGGETAAKIGVGTAAGALIGQILGEDTRSTLTGAGVGAAVGAVVALSTRGGNVTLPAGSTMQARLDEPLVVS